MTKCTCTINTAQPVNFSCLKQHAPGKGESKGSWQHTGFGALVTRASSPKSFATFGKLV